LWFAGPLARFEPTPQALSAASCAKPVRLRSGTGRRWPFYLVVPERFALSARGVWNGPSFSYEQKRLFESKREDVSDARSAEIDAVDHFRKFLDQTHTHRVRVIAKSADPMHPHAFRHHPCHIDTQQIFTFTTSNRDACIFGRPILDKCQRLASVLQGSTIGFSVSIKF
jgi:hypothetical protein